MSQARPSGKDVVVGVVGGLFSGLLGIGGGTAMVPLLVLVQRVTQRDAHAISLAAMIPIAVGALLVYGVAGEVDPAAAAALAAGAIFGARLGAELLSRAPERPLKAAFGVVLLFAALMLVVEG